MPSTLWSRILLSFAICAVLLGLLSAYMGLAVTSSFPRAITRHNKTLTSQNQVSVCAVNPKEDWLAQSTNQSLTSTNLLLVCPHVVDVLLTNPQLGFTQQLRDYLDYHLRQGSGSSLDWVFFLKDHDMLFGHSPRSLRKFLATAPTEVSILSFGHGRRGDALDLFAIRIDEWALDLLDTSAQLLNQWPSLTETEAMNTTLASSNQARKVVYVPQWWLEVGSSCVEDATWESQFGINHVITPDKLCCTSDSCRENLNRIGRPFKTIGDTGLDSQEPLTPGSASPIEHYIEDFWECVRDLDIIDQASPVLQLSEAIATEQKAAGTCRD